MGVPLEHVLEVALEEEHQKEQASTERDKDMVGAFLELLKGAAPAPASGRRRGAQRRSSAGLRPAPQRPAPA
ncbi:hypothetical protein AB1Y20_005274 [Prymnesium parvum]|uniref:Uncharacterized protein n=1 Tax=Prymnesium parvum TaxID=97485 RepID=A0AB34J3U9_PRYPA